MRLQDTCQVFTGGYFETFAIPNRYLGFAVENLFEQLPTEIAQTKIVKAVQHLIFVHILHYQVGEKVTFLS